MKKQCKTVSHQTQLHVSVGLHFTFIENIASVSNTSKYDVVKYTLDFKDNMEKKEHQISH